VGSLLGDIARSLRAQAPVPYAPRGQRSLSVMSALSSRASMETYMRAMGVSGTVFQVVSTLATATSKPGWHLYRKPAADGRVRYTTSDQGSDQRVEVVQHQALKVWQRPNPFYTNTAFVKAFQQHRELTGEAYWLIEFAGATRIPAGLWPARPDRMEPVPSRDSFLAGYLYTGPDGEKIPFLPGEVIMMKDPNPLDAYHGLGPVQSVLVDIDAQRYSAEWNRSFFLNGAEPGAVLMTPNELGDDEFDQLIARWRETHQGISRAHRVALLENGVTWQQTTPSQKDADFVNLHGMSRDTILEAWGIHKHIMGITEDVNRANAITAEEIFQDSKVTPRLDDIRDTLNYQFLPLFYPAGQDPDTEFDYVNPRPVNREADALELKAKAQAALWLQQAGYDPGDICTVVGLPLMGTVPVGPDTAGTSGADDTGPDAQGTSGDESGAGPGAWMPFHPAARSYQKILNGHHLANGHSLGAR